MTKQVRRRRKTSTEGPNLQLRTGYDDKWLCTIQAARFLKTTPKQIRNLVWQGRLHSYKPFGKLLFSRAELEKLIGESSRKEVGRCERKIRKTIT